MDLGTQSATGASDRLRAFFLATPEEYWWARAMVLSRNTPSKFANLKQALVASIRDVTKLRGEVEFVPAGSLPNDGKVIDDTRRYG